MDKLKQSLNAVNAYALRQRTRGLTAFFPFAGDTLDKSGFGRTIALTSTPGYVTDGFGLAARKHVAIVRSSGALYIFINGELKSSGVIVNTKPVGTLRFLGPSNTCRVQNLRILSVALQTSGTFPVPTGFYTGYEAV